VGRLLADVSRLPLLALAGGFAGTDLALQQDGHADCGEKRRAGRLEQPGVDAVDERDAGVGTS
jgi:hypothetical protein